MKYRQEWNSAQHICWTIPLRMWKFGLGVNLLQKYINKLNIPITVWWSLRMFVLRSTKIQIQSNQNQSNQNQSNQNQSNQTQSNQTQSNQNQSNQTQSNQNQSNLPFIYITMGKRNTKRTGIITTFLPMKPLFQLVLTARSWGMRFKIAPRSRRRINNTTCGSMIEDN